MWKTLLVINKKQIPKRGAHFEDRAWCGVIWFLIWRLIHFVIEHSNLISNWNPLCHLTDGTFYRIHQQDVDYKSIHSFTHSLRQSFLRSFIHFVWVPAVHMAFKALNLCRASHAANTYRESHALVNDSKYPRQEQTIQRGHSCCTVQRTESWSRVNECTTESAQPSDAHYSWGAFCVSIWPVMDSGPLSWRRPSVNGVSKTPGRLLTTSVVLIGWFCNI